MRTKMFLGIALLAVLFTGCKNEKAADSLDVVKPVEVDTNFKVIIDVIAKNDDDFGMYYTTDGTINFFNTTPVWQGFKGSETVQQVTFIVPDEIVPTAVRVDFGMKQDQPDITLQKLTLSYMGKTHEFVGAKIWECFTADPNQCTVNPATSVITAKVKDGKRLTPSIYPNQEMIAQIIGTLSK